MTITAIKPYEKGKNRFAVYLNDEFAFVLYKGELSKYGLFENIELGEDVYHIILAQTLLPRAKKRGMNLLLKMDRTESDLRGKLKDGGYPESVIDETIDYLKSFHYIDDSRYASEFIRFKCNSMSKREIYKRLSDKGISNLVIEEQFNLMEEELGQSSIDKELEIVKKLIIKKCCNLQDIDYAQRMKLFAYLYRKGFTNETIERAYKDLT